MPKDKKKARRDSSSSDSGPEDKGPAKKAKPAAGSSSGSCTMENGEPTWLVGGMKFVKVFFFQLLLTLQVENKLSIYLHSTYYIM